MQRRKFITGVGLATITAVAGCTGSDDDSGSNDGSTTTDDGGDEPGTTDGGNTTDEDSTVDSPSSDRDILSQYPRVTAYDANQLTVEIPPGTVPDVFTSGGDILVGVANYKSRDIAPAGLKSYNSLSQNNPTKIAVPLDFDATGVPDVPVQYVVDIGNKDEQARERLTETDRFEFDGSDIVRNPHDLTRDSRNADDPDAGYRRAVGEGTYAIQLQGVTDETPWQFDFRVLKSEYVEMVQYGNESDPSPNDRIQRLFNESRGDQREGMFFRRALTETADNYDFSGRTWLHFAADVVRALPEMPAVNSASDDPTRGLRQTFVDGGGDIDAVATALAGLTIWDDYETVLIYAEDHAAVGVVGDGFEGYARGDDPKYYWLEPTPIDGYVGTAPEEMKNVPTVTDPIRNV